DRLSGSGALHGRMVLDTSNVTLTAASGITVTGVGSLAALDVNSLSLHAALPIYGTIQVATSGTTRTISTNAFTNGSTGQVAVSRSEERRVGKECRSRKRGNHSEKNSTINLSVNSTNAGIGTLTRSGATEQVDGTV